MFVSASTRCFPELPPAEAVDKIADLEFSHYELWFGNEYESASPQPVVADPERFAARLREVTRMTPAAITVADDPDTETFRGIARLAMLLRVTQITVQSSPLGSPFNTEIDRLRSYVGLGGEQGIRVSIKTEIGRLSEDPQTAVELCESVRGLGITLDASHYVCGPHRGKSYDVVFPHVYHVHLRDTSAEAIQVPAGLGEIDYSRMVNQLRREGYEQALSVELVPSMLDQAERPLEMRKLRMLLETLI